MQNNALEKELYSGFTTAFIDSNFKSNSEYRSSFISNNHQEGKKVLSSIEDELLASESFQISVAFITMSGITPLLQTLKELERRGVPGRILTTNYLSFSEPAALQKLNELTNIKLKMYDVDAAGEGFHTKGYIFQQNGVFRIIVGSANMTSSALTVNREWNTKIVATKNGEMTQQILAEYAQLWDSEYAKPYDEIQEQYEEYFRIIKEQRKVAAKPAVVNLQRYSLKPNSMQVNFITNLKKLVDRGENRALLISATGTGKTYASAFALRELKPNRALFIVHREQIAKQALASYQRVFDNSKSFGLLSGNSKDLDSDYLFATMQMMAKPEVLEKFAKDTFDIIVVDEVHRAGAESYQRIFNYFQPKLWLGMSATPERTDDYDIYKLFDHNIAYEIRLQQALEEKLLCTFHYFGISELTIDGEILDDMTAFTKLVCEDRVNYIIEQANYYGYSGNRVKGLAFCRSREEAKELSRQFNLRGYNTTFLSGDDSQQRREECIERLSADHRPDQLDYIFTVDIFNEGVDIPEVNQILMLRPTESAIIFVQQLGRGLRKANDKEYVVILDFIGNYANNFMIPIALSGDRTYNKDTIRRYVMEGTKVIPGSSTVHFDEITKKRIFDSIDASSVKYKMLKEGYFNLKRKLDRVPTVVDFEQFGELDPMLFIEYSKSYSKFVQKVDPDYAPKLTQKQEDTLEFVSSWVLSGKRIHEVLLLKRLMHYDQISQEMFKQDLHAEGVAYKEKDYLSAVSVLNKAFMASQANNKKYALVEILDSEKAQKGFITRALAFANELEKNTFREELQNLLELATMRYRKNYAKHDEDKLVLYAKYSRKDVCQILNWDHDDSQTVYGYRIKHNTCPIFVTYEKQDDISESTKYEDRFINEEVFNWMTRSRVSANSTEALQLSNAEEIGLKVYLFVKKSDGEGTDFYYMGRVTPDQGTQTTIMDDHGKELPIMNYKLRLEHAVRPDIYDYFTHVVKQGDHIQ